MGVDQIPADVSWFVARYSGASGRAWLEQLPAVIGSAAARWDLDIEHPLSGGLLSCVLATRRRNGGPAVLTIASPWAPARHEALALEHWDGGPSPRLLDFDDRLPALLLERIWPGDMAAGESCDRVARLISTLHAVPPASAQVAVLPSLAEAVEQRFVTAPAEASARSEAQLAALAPKIQLARQAAGGLLRSFAGPHVLLHGDLGRRNVVRCQQRGLAAIDPAPCIGDPAYDAAYWAADEREAAGLEQRCHALALHASLDPGRVLGWSSVTALAAQEPPRAFPP